VAIELPYLCKPIFGSPCNGCGFCCQREVEFWKHPELSITNMTNVGSAQPGGSHWREMEFLYPTNWFEPVETNQLQSPAR